MAEKKKEKTDFWKFAKAFENPFTTYAKTFLKGDAKPQKIRCPNKIKLLQEYLATEVGKTTRVLMLKCIQNYGKTMLHLETTPEQKQAECDYFLALKKSRGYNGNPKAITALRKLNTMFLQDKLFSRYFFAERVTNIWRKEMKFNLKNLPKISAHDQLLFALFKKWFETATGLKPDDQNLELYLCINHFNTKSSTYFDCILTATMCLGVFGMALGLIKSRAPVATQPEAK